MLLSLVQIIALMFALTYAQGIVFRRMGWRSRRSKTVSGLVFGFSAVAGMAMSVEFMPGFIFDPRSVIVSLSGFFGGWAAALPAMILAGAFRLWLGGGGAFVGASIVVISGISGCAYYYYRKRRHFRIRAWHFLVFGLATHVLSFPPLLLLPEDARWHVIPSLTASFLFLFPIATVLLGWLILDLRAAAQAVEETKAGESRLHAILDLAPVSIIITRLADGVVKYANPMARQTFGFSADEIDHISALSFYDDLEDRDLFIDALAECDEVFDFELKAKSRDGTPLILSANARRTDLSGEEVVIACLVDLAESRESQRRLQLVFDHMPDVMVLYDADLRIQYINPATTKVSGYPPDFFIGKRDIDIWPPKVYSTYLPTLKEARDSGRICSTRAEITLQGVEPKDLEITCIPIKGSNGEVRQILGITHDLTVLMTSQRRLSELEKRHDVAMDAVNDGLWDWDLTTDEVYFSPQWKRILGYEDFEIPNRFNEWERRVHPDDLPVVESKVEAATKDPSAPFEAEFRMLHKNKTWVDILARGSVITDEEGTPVRFVGTHVDLTELKSKEREIERLVAICKTISRCNSALVHTKDEGQLIRTMCDILIDTLGYHLVWIGFVDADGCIDIRGSAGATEALADSASNSWSTDTGRQTPEARAIETGATQVTASIAKSHFDRSWIQFMKDHHMRTCIALPLIDQGNSFGVLGIYSSRSDVFDDEEVAVLEEFAADLTFGVSMIRAQDARDLAARKLSNTLLETINAIALTVEKRDPYTAGHQRRVAELATSIARRLNWPEERIEGLRLGATIHDIGKVYVPSEILNRPGKLTDHEFGLIKTHTQVGADIVAAIDFPWPVREMVSQHHEKIDGSGYPDGLKGDEIVDEAKIIAVADVVEAVTSHRPYRPALGIEKGIDVIVRGRGTAFDPEVVDACPQVIDEDEFTWDSTGSQAF